MRLTTRHDPLPELFDAYHATLVHLRGGAPLEGCLRLFEKRLLEMLGYGLDLASEAAGGEPVRAERYYHFRAGARPDYDACREPPGALAGRSLLALAREELSDARTLEDARRLLQAALGACLEGRPLAHARGGAGDGTAG